MSELASLYQDLILDHSKRPRCRGALPTPPAHKAEGHNPLCGDRVTMYVELDDEGAVQRAAFEGVGCAICTASASLLAEAATGRSADELERMFERFSALVRGEADAVDAAAELGKLAAFAGVSAYPMRVKCATLPWHTLREAIRGGQRPVTTEDGP